MEPLFHVVTDGGCDLLDAMKVQPEVAPLSLHFGSETFQSGALAPADFYAKLESSSHHPTTSQPSPGDFLEIYRRLTDKPVLSLHIAGALSGTLNSARQALKEVPEAEVHLHDTKTLSIAQGFQVYAACEAARRGETMEVALEWVRRVQQDTELLFTIDTLVYLQKGGRIGRVTAVIGSLLKLKPVIHVSKENGTYDSVGRARTFRKAAETLIAKAAAYILAGSALRAGVVYGDNAAEADELLAALGSEYEIGWSGTAPVGPVLAVHTGPRALGLCVAPGRWPWEEVPAAAS